MASFADLTPLVANLPSFRFPFSIIHIYGSSCAPVCSSPCACCAASSYHGDSRARVINWVSFWNTAGINNARICPPNTHVPHCGGGYLRRARLVSATCQRPRCGSSGLITGISVNVFYRVGQDGSRAPDQGDLSSRELARQEREFQIGSIGFADSSGILIASLVAMPTEVSLCHAQVQRGKFLCKEL